MRFIRIPEGVLALDHRTDEPIVNDAGEGEIVTFATVVKTLFCDPRLPGMLDADVFAELRKKLTKAKPGTVVELFDEHWSPLASIARRPQSIRPEVIFFCVPLLRAIYDAPTQRPETFEPVAAAS